PAQSSSSPLPGYSCAPGCTEEFVSLQSVVSGKPSPSRSTGDGTCVVGVGDAPGPDPGVVVGAAGGRGNGCVMQCAAGTVHRSKRTDITGAVVFIGRSRLRYTALPSATEYWSSCWPDAPRAVTVIFTE